MSEEVKSASNGEEQARIKKLAVETAVLEAQKALLKAQKTSLDRAEKQADLAARALCAR